MMAVWEALAARSLLERSPWLSVWEEDVRLPNGLVIQGYLRTCSREYAMTFALLADGTVPLVQQYKRGPDRLVYDLPAGYLDTPDEPPLIAAQRELREETGITAGRWRELGHPVIDTNRADTRAHLFLALDARQTVAQQLDPTETLTVSYHTPSELRSLVLSGAIDSLATVAAIMTALQIDEVQRV
jgi:8-oxo-dGTP pyrophosphatase MutT (NUDIX family)